MSENFFVTEKTHGDGKVCGCRNVLEKLFCWSKAEASPPHSKKGGTILRALEERWHKSQRYMVCG
jgi:hypothetical protein